MAKYTYKGDSPGKKIIRARLWLSIRSWMHIFEQRFLGALVLAGEGGDIGAIQGWGMDTGKITAVDQSKTAIRKVHRKTYNGSLKSPPRLVVGEAGEVALRNETVFNVAHLDFCGGLCVENMKTLVDVAKGATSYPLLLGVTMLKGRESSVKPRAPFVPDEPRRKRRMMAKHFEEDGHHVSAKMFSHGPFNPKELLFQSELLIRSTWAAQNPMNTHGGSISGVDLNGNLNGLGAALIRADCARQILNACLASHDMSALLMNVWGYMSTTKKARGTPFATFIFLVSPRSKVGKLYDLIEDNAHLIVYYNLSRNLGMSALKHYVIDSTKAMPNERVAQLFDVTIGQIAAWKAHHTMGTYNDEYATMKDEGLGFSSFGHGEFLDRNGWGWVTSVILKNKVTIVPSETDRRTGSLVAFHDVTGEDILRYEWRLETDSHDIFKE